MEQRKVPGTAVAIVQENVPVYLKGFGVRNVQTREPVTPDTLFDIGSFTKALTSAAIAMLVDDGKLRWDDKVNQSIPFFHLNDPLADESVTLCDLLTHRTGVPVADRDPVPYRERPISPTYPGADWRTWEAADQRFVDHRPDVLTFQSATLDHDITVTGPLTALLFASTSGTDSDFVVKLIDEYPQDAQKDAWNGQQGPGLREYRQSMNGYELPIAMEVLRGRYLVSNEHSQALVPDKPVQWDVPLRDHDQVFLKGHRILVQIQSTWLPVIDRNPQKFVPSIYEAKAVDYRKTTQRVFCSAAMPSHLVLPHRALVSNKSDNGISLNTYPSQNLSLM